MWWLQRKECQGKNHCFFFSITRMAIAACFAGPLFNMLIGLGISLTIKCLANYPNPYLVDLTLKLYIAFGFLILSLVSTLIFVPLKKYTVTRSFGIYLLLLNLLFSAVSFTVEFTNLKIHIPHFFLNIQRGKKFIFQTKHIFYKFLCSPFFDLGVFISSKICFNFDFVSSSKFSKMTSLF